MALAIAASGTQSSVIGTEHVLTTLTTAKTFCLKVDTAAMLNSDVLELRLYDIALAAGTERVAYYVAYAHIQGTPIKISVPVPSNISFKATLKQVAGTARSFPWVVLSLD